MNKVIICTLLRLSIISFVSNLHSDEVHCSKRVFWFLRPVKLQTWTLISTYRCGMKWTQAAPSQVQQHMLTCAVWTWLSHFSIREVWAELKESLHAAFSVIFHWWATVEEMKIPFVWRLLLLSEVAYLSEYLLVFFVNSVGNSDQL